MSAPSIRLVCGSEHNAAKLRDREWLVTNGLGGYASGTVLGVPTRRYHGLFVPNLARPEGRHVMIGRYDEEVIAGDARALLGGADLEDGTTETDAAACLREFTLHGLVPTWRYAVGTSTIEKSIVMPHGRNVVCVLYRLLDGPPVRLHARPYAVFRRQDAPLVTAPAPFRLTIEGGRHELALGESALALRLRARPDGVFVAHERTPACALYREERDRGYEHVELNFSPGYFAVDLRRGRPVTFAATTDDWRSLEVDGEEALAAERQRTEAVLALALPAARDEFSAQLALAADQFLVLPGSRLEEALRAGAAGTEVRTVIAGYHWFGDWGRDTMIGLEGLTLATGRLREAGAILRTFARYVRDGLLPNLFPEGAREARYNTIDATLWYFHALERYSRACASIDLVRELYPVLEEIIAHHLAGTRFGIGVDPADGLLAGGGDGVALTWMDARFEDWVVTPRRGKPVEIQALWHNALALMGEWAGALGRAEGEYLRRAAHVRETFNARFWNERAGALFDVVDGPNGHDTSCRPNQIFAVSLRFPVLEERRWRAVVDTVQAHLLTPYGLRTLAPGEVEYRRDYHGDLRTRDAAYHQGTVWPWLIGHFVDAWLRVYGDRDRARAMLAALPAHLAEAGVGSISEICDAEAPFRPRGCIAQAWSVAEVLRAWQATAARDLLPDAARASRGNESSSAAGFDAPQARRIDVTMARFRPKHRSRDQPGRRSSPPPVGILRSGVVIFSGPRGVVAGRGTLRVASSGARGLLRRVAPSGGTLRPDGSTRRRLPRCAATTRGAAARLGSEGAMGRRPAGLPLQRALDTARAFRVRSAAARLRVVLARPPRQLHAGAPRLGQPDRDRLLGRPRAMLALADVVDLLAHELARLGARRFAFAGVPAGALNGSLFRHVRSFRTAPAARPWRAPAPGVAQPRGCRRRG